MEQEYIKFIQSGTALVVALLSLYYNRRIAEEMKAAFMKTYGKWFGMESIFNGKLFWGFLRFGFVVFGIGALIFAIFNITGPLN